MLMNIPLPNYQHAYIALEKLTLYALNPEKEPDKSYAFKQALDYTPQTASHLIQNILSNLAHYTAKSKGRNNFGQLYECVLPLTGPNNRTANVLTGWIILDNEDFPRLTSIYVTKKKGQPYAPRTLSEN